MNSKETIIKMITLFVLCLIAVFTLVFAGNAPYKAGLVFGLLNLIVSGYWIYQLYKKWYLDKE